MLLLRQEDQALIGKPPPDRTLVRELGLELGCGDSDGGELLNI